MDRLQEIVAAALENFETTEREAFVRAECGDDPELVREVLSLLRYADRAEQLDIGAVLSGSRLAGRVLTDLEPGTRISHFELVELIGRGSTGVVWRAHQDHPVVRDVALKVLDRGWDHDVFLARFMQEQRILAALSHPGIAQVYGSGVTPDARPFYAMELIDGIGLLDHCDARRLTVRERLTLLGEICRAVQHAHSRGAIHRDLNPGNILCYVDDKGVSHAKVIDFGIARGVADLSPEGPERTHQSTVLGTFHYMSPEQMKASHDVDVTTDVYALGVVLYVLLTGVRPLGVEAEAATSPGRMLVVLGEETAPSMRRRLAADDVDIARVSECRRMTPDALRSVVTGELQWIVQRAMEKDRSKRFASAEALGRDVESFLMGRAVDSAPPSLSYRTRKFVSRHREPIAALSAVFLVLVIGLVVSTNLYVDAEASRATLADRLHTSRLRSVEISLLAGEVEGARRALGSIPVAERGWLWSVLQRRSDTSLLAAVWEETPITLGNLGAGRVVVVTKDGRVRAWDTTNRHRGQNPTNRVTDLARIDAEITAAAMGPNLRWLVHGDGSSILRVWTPTGEHELPPLPADVVDLAAVPGTELVIASDLEGRVLPIDVERRVVWPSLIERTTEKAAPLSLRSTAVSADGRRVALFSRTDRRVRVLDRLEGSILVEVDLESRLATSVFDPEGERLVMGGLDGTIRVLSIADGRLDTVAAHASGVQHVLFVAGGRRLVSADEDGVLRIWNAETWVPIRRAFGHRNSVQALLALPEDGRLVTAGVDGTTRVWREDLRSSRAVPTEGEAVGATSTAVVDQQSDGMHWTGSISAGSDPTERLLGGVRDEFHGWVHEATKVVVQRESEGLVVVDLEDSPDSEAEVLLPNPVSVHRRAASGGRFAISDLEGRIMWWDLDTDRRGEFDAAFHLGHAPAFVTALAIEERAPWIAFGDSQGRVAVVDLRNGSTLMSIQAYSHGSVSALCFGSSTRGSRPDRLYTAARREPNIENVASIRSWSVRDGIRLSDLGHPEATVERLLRHPLEGWIVAAEREGTIRVLDPDTSSLVARLYTADRLVEYAEFDRRSGELVTITRSKTVEVW